MYREVINDLIITMNMYMFVQSPVFKFSLSLCNIVCFSVCIFDCIWQQCLRIWYVH